jgi:hypothetical protein
MNFLAAALAAAMLSACGGGGKQQAATEEPGAATETPVAVLAPDEKYSITGKPQGPVKIDYRIIGTPVVGQPVTIDLKVKSNVGDTPVTLSYEKGVYSSTSPPTCRPIPVLCRLSSRYRSRSAPPHANYRRTGS